MAATRNPAYARACFYGTDGNAALVGEQIATPKPVKRRVPAHKGFPVRRWAVALSVAAALLIAFGMLSGSLGRERVLKAQIASQRMYVQEAQDKLARTERELAEQSNDHRIRTLAENRLFMIQPEEAQVVHIPKPYLAAQETSTWQPQTEKQSIWQIFLSVFQ